ncbi:MAG: sugar phosphate nucleotidyltransferase, partial [Ilumatobacteraceae bacterium]
MKALILAGGAGTRLRPITHTSAKQLVPVANKPILFYGIDAMVSAGITEIGVIVGDTRAEVMAALGDGSAFGAHITFIPQDAPLGLAHCVLIASDFLGDDDFVMYLGDNLLEQDLAAFVRAFEEARGSAEPPAAQILLKQVPDPHRFGIAELDASGNVVRRVEKPA